MVLRTSNGTVQVRPGGIGGVRVSWTVAGNKWAAASVHLPTEEAQGFAAALVAFTKGEAPVTAVEREDGRVWHPLRSTPHLPGGWVLRHNDCIFMTKPSIFNVAKWVAGEDGAVEWLNNEYERRKDRNMFEIHLEHLDETACKLTFDQATQLVEVIQHEAELSPPTAASMVLRTSNGTVQVHPSEGGWSEPRGPRLSWTVAGNKWAATTIAMSIDEAQKLTTALVAFIGDRTNLISPTEMWHSIHGSGGYAHVLRNSGSIFMVGCSSYSAAQRIVGGLNHLDEIACKLTLEQATQLVEVIQKELCLERHTDDQ